MSNWTNPTNSSLYTDVLNELHELINKNATMLKDVIIDADTNLPENSIRWDNITNKFSIWSASAWGDLSSEYDINVLSLNGQVGSYYLDAANFTGTLPAGIIDDAAHGILTDQTLHSVATDTVAGFMSAQDKLDLVAAANRTTTEVETIVKDTLDTGINSLLYSSMHSNVDNDTVIDVGNGNYQKVTFTIPSSLSFVAKGTVAYTIYIYITTGGNTITIPPGTWLGGKEQLVNSGTCILTVDYDGTGYYYSVDYIVLPSIFDNASNLDFNYINGDIQEAIYTVPATITFTDNGTAAYTMKLYINTGNNLVTLPSGYWPGGIAIAIDTGICILTVSTDGLGKYFYSLEKDMQLVV